MSRLWLAAALIVAAGATQAHAAGDLILVTLDQARVARVPAGASTIILGNPMIADVTMLKDTNAYVITGKGFGQTNLIAIDAQGVVIEEELLRVVPAKTVLVLQSGPSRISYACNPECMPTVQLGDEQKSFEEAGAQITVRNGYAAAGAAAVGPANK
jgi:Pilus formation protein N terminal region